MKLAVITATMYLPHSRGCIGSWLDTITGKDYRLIDIDNSQVNIGVLPAMQKAYLEIDADILAYFHDDLTIHEMGWDERILKQFEDPTVGVVGFGGSLWHGSPDIYKTPYYISQLGRSYYMSNTDDWEVHGGRFTGERAVATVDGFVLIVRHSFLDRIGGWPVDCYPPHHVYDHFITLAAHRNGFKVVLVGVKCQHGGGQTATSGKYIEWARTTKWGSDETMHEQGHRMIYEEFRDVLPVLLETQ